MKRTSLQTLYHSVRARLDAFENGISQRGSMLTFLVVRFVLMSGMVVGFTWFSLQHAP